MKEVVIVSGARTAVGSFGGSLKTTPVVEMAAQAIRSGEADEKANQLGLKPPVRIKAHASAGVDPAFMGSKVQGFKVAFSSLYLILNL